MINVESDEEIVGKMYKKLAWEILSEVHLSVIKDLFIYINVKEGYFISSANIRKSLEDLKVSNCAKLEEVKGGVKVVVDPLRERYLPNLLKTLLITIGEKKVTQLSRFEILANDSSLKDIENLTIVDLNKDAQKITMEILIWLAPEGFKVTSSLIDRDVMTILCSEHNFKKPWIEKMNRFHREFVESLQTD